MKLEQQVCSLELAKKLKELGVKQESVFWWRNDYPNNPGKYPDTWYIIPDSEYPYTGPHRAVEYERGLHLLPAFTVAEFGEMLPDMFYGSSHDEQHIRKYVTAFDGHSESEASEADARAKMLIYLIENKLIPPEPMSK